MKKAAFVVSKVYQENQIFNTENKELNRDDCLYGFHCLKKKFEDNGVDLQTVDINSEEDSEVVIYHDMPSKKPKVPSKSFLLVFESELIKPENWKLNNHQYFEKVFTWNDSLVDNKKYFKMNFPLRRASAKDSIGFTEKKLCTLISANKHVPHKRELYSARLEGIKWFQENAERDFFYFGFDWDRSYISQSLRKILRRLKLLDFFPKKKGLCYGGMVRSKVETLAKFKFSLCYENLRDEPGYITEKIFDCFFAENVPVYWGADNIKDYIPQECYIDKKQFSNYRDLYDFLVNMTEKEYQVYLSAIEKFLEGEGFIPFSAENFGEKITSTILNG